MAAPPIASPAQAGGRRAHPRPASPYIRWFDEISRDDVPLVGGKGANLGEMTRAGLPVPPGFVVTVKAYERFIAVNDLQPRIDEQLADLDVDDAARLRDACTALQALVREAPLPDDVRAAIRDAHAALAAEVGGSLLVAVRSSGTVEDAGDYSFAGMFASSLNVSGAVAVKRAVKECWASAFTARLLFYSAKRKRRTTPLVAAVVQQMVEATRSGVVFTVDPASGDASHMVIEGAWGLGEVVVLGQVTPDRFVVDKQSLAILERSIGHKEFMLARDPRTGTNEKVMLDEAKASAPVLSDDEVRGLAEIARRDEAHYGAPQDAEWAVDGGTIYLVQTRPVTTLRPRRSGAPNGGKGARKPAAAVATPAPPAVADGTGAVLVRGLGASPGTASGRARVLAAADQADALLQGEVLVTTMTSPDWVPVMRRAAAVVTDAGGMTSHAAIVSRELGIPCIVGARTATSVLRDGMEITVHGRDGVVTAGTTALAPPSAAASGDGAGGAVVEAAPPVTATRVYVNLGEPEMAEDVAQRDVDGVGLLRAEFLLLSALDRTHPRVFIRDGRGEELVSRMAQKLETFARAFHPRPVVYRAIDFRSNEFRGLTGGEEFEPHEANPMIGYRGCYRYTREPDLFALELKALKRVRERWSNLHLMVPFVRTGWEFAECKRLIDASGLTAGRDFELWVMAEVPSVVAWLEEYVRLGVTGVSIGSNDLTQLVLGVDRDSEVLAPLYDERDRAVLAAIRAIIAECKRLSVTCSICGQAPSVYPEYAEFLVQLGIDSVSVNPDVIETTRRAVAAAERRVLLHAARGDGAEA